MYNTRYHIASLVAVFLSLALGLVLGGLVVRSGAAGKQQASLVKGLRTEFASLRDQNKALTQSNAELSDYATAMTDSWTTGRLDGRTVVVYVVAGRNDGLNAVTDAIERAGGSAATITLAKPEFGLRSDALRSQVTSLVGDGDAKDTDKVASALAREWTTEGQERPLTTLLVDQGVLTIKGLGASKVATGLVDIAVRGAGADVTGLALTRAFVDLKLPVVGAQTGTATTGLAASVAEAGGSGFDTLGTDIGRYSLIALLSGAQSGLYGLAPDAQASFPPVP
jgi:hypothetical protein